MLVKQTGLYLYTIIIIYYLFVNNEKPWVTNKDDRNYEKYSKQVLKWEFNRNLRWKHILDP